MNNNKLFIIFSYFKVIYYYMALTRPSFKMTFYFIFIFIILSLNKFIQLFSRIIFKKIFYLILLSIF